MDNWEQRKAEMIAEYQAMVERLPVSDEPSPPLKDVNPTNAIYTRRDSKGNVYGYFPGCKSEGMLGWAVSHDRPLD